MNIGKSLIFVGIAIVIVGILFSLFKSLPGDIDYKGEKVHFYFPIVTSIVVSIILTILVNLAIFFFRE